ncbi:hypothetical protein ONZ45_g19293 [Pleurotus djamor]|nr:hypothetical protein ONZ45_g19293 [Pleurotus djamor]
MASVAARILSRRFHVSARRSALSQFNMPAMSPTMTEGGIASWKKKEGEAFAAGDVLLEIETDKATIDVEAQDDGIMAKIIVQDGSKGVKVGSPIAVLAEDGDDLAGADAFASQASSQASSEPKEDKPSPPPKPEAPTPEPVESKPKSESRPELASGDRIFASPIAKKIALERGIPLSKVKATSPRKQLPRPLPSPPAAQLPLDYVDTPVSNMRRVIGSRLTQSKQEIPHYYVTSDINMDKVLKLREVFNKTLGDKDKAAKLSVNDFILKAVSCALADVPEANSAWLGEVIRTYKKADISVAVATPTGLITPIVRDVGAKGLASISAETKALAKKARDGKLAPSEYQGGTFTVSNLGMYDVSHFTAIINPPQSCILAVGSTQATLVPAPEEERGFKTVQIMKVTLSSDHRTVDGAVAARWMAAFRGNQPNHLQATVSLPSSPAVMENAPLEDDNAFWPRVLMQLSQRMDEVQKLKAEVIYLRRERDEHDLQARAFVEHAATLISSPRVDAPKGPRCLLANRLLSEQTDVQNLKKQKDVLELERRTVLENQAGVHEANQTIQKLELGLSQLKESSISECQKRDAMIQELTRRLAEAEHDLQATRARNEALTQTLSRSQSDLTKELETKNRALTEELHKVQEENKSLKAGLHKEKDSIRVTLENLQGRFRQLPHSPQALPTTQAPHSPPVRPTDKPPTVSLSVPITVKSEGDNVSFIDLSDTSIQPDDALWCALFS